MNWPLEWDFLCPGASRYGLHLIFGKKKFNEREEHITQYIKHALGHTVAQREALQITNGKGLL